MIEAPVLAILLFVFIVLPFMVWVDSHYLDDED